MLTEAQHLGVVERLHKLRAKVPVDVFTNDDEHTRQMHVTLRASFSQSSGLPYELIEEGGAPLESMLDATVATGVKRLAREMLDWIASNAPDEVGHYVAAKLAR